MIFSLSVTSAKIRIRAPIRILDIDPIGCPGSAADDVEFMLRLARRHDDSGTAGRAADTLVVITH